MTRVSSFAPVFFLFILLFSPAYGGDDDILSKSSPSQPSGVWEIEGNICQMEYAVTWQETSVIPEGKPGYHMANRTQDLRVYFHPEGLEMVRRTEVTPTWIFGFRLARYGHQTNLTKSANPLIQTHKNCLEYLHGDLTVAYENQSGGIKQSMTLQHPPAGTGRLFLEAEIPSSPGLFLTEDGKSLEIRIGDHVALSYGSLEARDAEGHLLPSMLSLVDRWLTVEADDSGAIYPVTIHAVFKGTDKGLSRRSDTLVGSTITDASFGHTVSTAGDINGDGFSDVIVGAPNYDGGQANEGRVFVYYGSASGITTTGAWTAEINIVNARFGFSVATAGDVNGDGYADVLIGAIGVVLGGGAVYLWEGSSSGLGANGTPLNADWQASNNQALSFFGSCVGTAGDINGDGYSDIIIGAKEYRSGDLAEGSIFVWHGSPDGLPGSPTTPASAVWRYDCDSANAQLGSSVGTAGDVNGDGFSDIIAGAPGYNSNLGRSYVFYGSRDGLNGSAIDTIEEFTPGSKLGYSVGTAGDVNGDGYSDVVVGVPFVNTEHPTTHATIEHGGQVRIYHGSSTGISTTSDQTLDGIDDNGQLGYSVATAGDVNGDGYADVIAGAPGVFYVGSDAGYALVWLGSIDGVQDEYHWSNSAFLTDARYGSSVATAGDVNGDGYSDIIVGSPGYVDGDITGGAASLYHGAPADVNNSCEWSNGTGQQGSWYGMSVGTAGDINGDGYADVIVGAPNYDGGQIDEGRVFVYLGGAIGLGTIPAWRAESNQAGAKFGSSARSAGDFNGDGYSDVIVGSYWYDAGSYTNSGSAFIWYGSNSGLGANGNPSNADAIITANQSAAWLGWSVGTAGDVNRDGFDDVLAGAPGYDQDEINEGAAFLVLGSQEGLTTSPTLIGLGQANALFGTSVGTAGDVNADGFADIIIGAPGYRNGETAEGGAFVYYGSSTGVGAVPNWTAESNQANAQMGISAGTAGDVNGDGYADVIIGAYLYDFLGGTFGGVDVGAAYLWYGGPSPAGLGPTGTPDNRDAWAGTLNPYSWCGWSVGTAGDVNGDGYSDIIVGAPYEGPSDSKEGHAYVYMGTPEGLGDSIWGDSGDQTSALFGSSVGTAGDVNGDGCADIIVGAYQYDVGSSTNEGRAFLYYGNNGRAPSLNPRQRLSDNSGPVADHGWINTNSIRLALRGRTPYGRGLVGFESEVKPFGTPFNGSGLQRTNEWLDTGISGVELSRVIHGLALNTFHHWRVRVLYHPAAVPFQPHSQWLTIPWNGWNEADFRTGSETEPVYNRITQFFGNGLGFYNISGENLKPDNIINSLKVFPEQGDFLLTRPEYLDLIR